MVRAHAEQFAKAHLPDCRSATYNPLDFIREDEDLAVRDINVLLDALLTPPRQEGRSSSLHFYESARAIIGGYIAWVRFMEPQERRTLARVYDLLSLSKEKRDRFFDYAAAQPRFAGGLMHMAIERQRQVGDQEGGSNFSTIANQLGFLVFPELLSNTSASTFDPATLARGDTDLFVVVPDEMIDQVRGWLRLWITIPNAIPNRRALDRDLLLIIDEMPRLGFLKPVVDAYNMAAGKGVHFWCFAQSISALDASWGKEQRKTLTHLAEVIQVLGFPRTDAEGAEELSKAIGTATYESQTENRSGTISESRPVAGQTSWQEGESRSIVREHLVTPDQLMTLQPDEQYVIAASKEMPRDALHLHHGRYWLRQDTKPHADPNPFVLRKERAEKLEIAREPAFSK